MPNLDFLGSPDIRFGDRTALAIMFGNRLVWTKPTGGTPFSYYSDFESNTVEGWMADGNTAYVDVSQDPVFDGNYSLVMYPGSSASGRTVKLPLSGFTPGTQYVLTCRMRRNSTSSTTGYIGVRGVADAEPLSSGGTTWAEVSLTFTATSTAHEIFMNLDVTSSARRLYLDNLSIQPA